MDSIYAIIVAVDVIEANTILLRFTIYEVINNCWPAGRLGLGSLNVICSGTIAAFFLFASKTIQRRRRHRNTKLFS